MMRTRTSMIMAAVGVSVAMLLCSASADTIVLTDATLLTFAPGSSGTLDGLTDIAGDPGVQIDFTFPVPSTPGAWAQAAFVLSPPAEIGLGDTWEMKIKNTDSDTLAFKMWMKVDSSWSYSEVSSGWVSAGDTVTLSKPNPATTDVKQIGLTVGTQGWIGRPDGSAATMQIVPEPSVVALLGMGALLMVLRRKRG